MSDQPQPLANRRGGTRLAVLALLAYVPALTAAPGRMPADSKLYLYLDPGRFLGDAASSFDPRQFAGWVPHQHIAYLWPSGPWFWLFEVLHVPDWIAHRLWIGTLMLAAGLGVRWCARLLGLAGASALTAAIVYQTSPYVLPYVSRTSVMLLPWAGLGWIVGLTVLAGRRRRWLEPAALALVVFTVGAVNATALLMIVPAPALWLLHAVWNRSLTWRQAAMVAVRVSALTVPVSIWWAMMLVIQGRSGAEVLPYSESLADVSLTATGPEVWRGLGYWLFYIRDPYSAATTESLRYLTSSWAILLSYAVPIVALFGLWLVRWPHRRFAALLIGAGGVLAVGVHPIDDRSPLMRVLAGNDDGGLALALRSSTRALPVMNLGLALLIGALASAVGDLRWPAGLGDRWGDRVLRRSTAAAVLAGVAIVNLPSLWTGAFVDPALERDQDPPQAWLDAAAALDAKGSGARVLQVPGAEFGAYRWGYTVDQPLPGLTEHPLVTRDLLPLGSAAAMDLVYALDDRIQDGVLEAEAVAPVARWLGVDAVWLTNDLAFDRFRTARPQVVGAVLDQADGVGEPESFGGVGVNQPQVAMTDERLLGDPQASAPVHQVDLYPIDRSGSVVRAGVDTVVVSGSGDGLVDAAAAGVLTGDEVVRYSASLDGDSITAELGSGTPLVVTDSNRSRARHWRSSQDTTGYTESDQPALELLREVSSDQRLPIFADRDQSVDPAAQTVARQVGPVTATATSYGEPFAYLPERRPYMAIDGNPATAWTVGEHADPVGETLRLEFAESPGVVQLLQMQQPDARRITEISVSVLDATSSTQPYLVSLGDESVVGSGQALDLGGATMVDLTITAVAGGDPGTAGAVAGVGFAEISSSLGPTLEVVRPPHDALRLADAATPLTFVFNRLQVEAMDRWRGDAEPLLVRGFELATPRQLDVEASVSVDQRASDADLATLFGWPVVASTRLTGSIANAGVAAFDGDPDTAWITAFGAAIGATLTIADVAEPVSEVTVDQPVEGLSAITSLALSSGGETRSVDLVPDAAGSATAVIDPPLPAGQLTVTIAAIDPLTTVDRRYADVVELPAGISELHIGGAARLDPVDEAQASGDCVAIADLDGQPLAFSFRISGADAVAGRAVVAQPCDRPLQLEATEHLVRGLPLTIPVTLDGLVLRDPGAPPPVAATDDPRSAPVVTVDESSRFHRRVVVDHCSKGCWLVFGEGYNAQWRASIDGDDLGQPELVDGGFNGWWLPGSPTATTVAVDWQEQRPLNVALIVSLLGVVAAAIVLGVGWARQRRAASDAIDPPAEGNQRPTLALPAPGATGWRPATSALVAWGAWVVLSAVLVSPVWAVAGFVGGAAMAIGGRSRVAESTALASVALVGVLVVVGERRHAPAPNGGWPATFADWHGLAVWALATVVVAAIVADDAQPSG